MKKLVSLMLAIALLLTAACFTASAEGEKMVINWAAGHDTDPIAEGDTVLAWLEEKFDVDINVNYIERDSYADLMGYRLAGGEVPDVFWCETTEMFSSVVSQGFCMEMPLDLVAELIPESYKWLMEYDPECFSLVSYNGKYYGLPRVNLDGNYTYAPFYRTSWLEAAGYTDGAVPMTIDELEDVFYTWKGMDPAELGSEHEIYCVSNTGLLPIFGAFGAIPDRWVDDGEGNLVYGAVYPGMKDALELLAKWYADGIIDPEWIIGENQGGHWCLSIPFEQGYLGFSSSGAFYQLEPDYDGEGSTYNWGKTLRTFVANYGYEDMTLGWNPVGPDGFKGGDNWGLTTAEAIVFNKELENDPEKLEKICEIIDCIGSDWETYLKIRNWDLNLDAYGYDPLAGYYKLDPEYTRPDEGSHGNMFNTLQNPYFAMKLNPARYNWANSMGQFDAKQNGGYPRTKLPITTASQPEYWTTLEDYRQAQYVAFITGARSVDEFDAFCAEWYNMGGEIITEEANAWYQK